MASEHTVGFEPADRLAKERESVRRRFWIKLKRVVAKLPFAEDLLAAYYCAFDKQTPRHVQAALLGAIAYFILPFDFIPDMLPVLGFTDDAAILATAIRLVAGHITQDHRDAARAALKPDVIFTGTSPAVDAIRRETKTIPIVFVGVNNPLAAGFVSSLAHPGGNITGFANVEPSAFGKMIALLKEIAPRTRTIAFMYNKISGNQTRDWIISRETTDAAAKAP